MNDQPLREIRPVIVPSQFWVSGLIVSLLGALIIGFVFFVIGNIIAGFASFNKPLDRADFGPKTTPGIVGYFLGVIGLLYYQYLKTFVEPGRIVYRIYPNRIDYEEGLFNRQARSVLFDKVIDITLTESVLQQNYNAGSLNLVTQELVPTGNRGQLANRTITLANLPQPREVYELLKSLRTEKGQGST